MSSMTKAIRLALLFLAPLGITVHAADEPRPDARTARLKKLAETTPVIAFVKRHPITPSFYAYTESQSDAQKERHFRPGSKLCLLEIQDAECWV